MSLFDYIDNHGHAFLALSAILGAGLGAYIAYLSSFSLKYIILFSIACSAGGIKIVSTFLMSGGRK